MSNNSQLRPVITALQLVEVMTGSQLVLNVQVTDVTGFSWFQSGF